MYKEMGAYFHSIIISILKVTLLLYVSKDLLVGFIGGMSILATSVLCLELVV